MAKQILRADGCEYMYWQVEVPEGKEVFVQFPPAEVWHKLTGATDTEGHQGFRLLCAGPKAISPPEGAVTLQLGHNPTRLKVISSAETVIRDARRITVVSVPGTGPGSVPPASGGDWLDSAHQAAAAATAAGAAAETAAAATAAGAAAETAAIAAAAAGQSAANAASVVDAATAAANRDVIVHVSPLAELVIPDTWEGWRLLEVRMTCAYESPDGTPHPATVYRYPTEDDFGTGTGTPDTVATVILGPSSDPAKYQTRQTVAIGQLVAAGQVFSANVARSWWKLRPAV